MARAVAKSEPKVAEIRDRVCEHCGRNFGIMGPLPYAADHHLHAGKMVLSCSSSCRVRLGLSERKSA